MLKCNADGATPGPLARRVCARLPACWALPLTKEGFLTCAASPSTPRPDSLAGGPAAVRRLNNGAATAEASRKEAGSSSYAHAREGRRGDVEGGQGRQERHPLGSSAPAMAASSLPPPRSSAPAASASTSTPALIREARENALKAGVADKVKFLQQDVVRDRHPRGHRRHPLLLPEVNRRLRPKLLSDLKPGTRVVSHNHDMGDWTPLKTLNVRVPQQNTILKTF